MVTITVDYNRWGPSHRVRVGLIGTESELLHVGDPVTVEADDEIPERVAIVEELSENGAIAVLAFKNPWPS